MINVENISKLSGIYKFTNKINNKCYIGKAKNLQTRVEGHLKSFLNENHSSYFYKSVRKHGIENFQFEILEEFEKDKITNNELNELEKYWIWIFKSSNSKFGYNLTKGGDGLNSNEETRKKQSISQTGKKQSEEQIKKRVLKLKGKKRTEEFCNFLKLQQTGKKHSEETREKLKLFKKKKKRNPLSEETKKKISKSNKGKKRTEEQVEKNRLNQLGKKQSLETIEKRRLKLKGKKHSAESIKNMVNGRKKNRKPISEETREKLIQSHLGKKLSKESIEKRTKTQRLNKNIKLIQENNFVYDWLF